MVVIQVKNGDHDSFLYETTCDTLNDDLVRDMVRVWNMRIRLAQLIGGLREMAEYGPMKHPEKAGIDEIQEKYNQAHIDRGEFYKPDPTGIRTGNGVGPQLTETIERVIRDVESILDKVRYSHPPWVEMHPLSLPGWPSVHLLLFTSVNPSHLHFSFRSVLRTMSRAKFPSRSALFKRNWTSCAESSRWVRLLWTGKSNEIGLLAFFTLFSF